MKPPTLRPRLSTEQVVEKVSAAAPGIVEHIYLDRDWLWYCGPSLQGEANKPVRQTLKSLGFRWSPSGHVMPDGKTKGSWGNSCHRPMFSKRRRPASNRNHQSEDSLAALAAMGL